jgi:serine/threonine protein kinase
VAWNLEAPRPFLVFELARAGTLADEMQTLRARRKSYHPVVALRRTRAILTALDQIHSRGLIHRDVKPANLLRFADGIKLSDFGAGKTLARAAALESEEFVGTRAYAAPEQLRGELGDDRSDLYSVGSILVEMLTGDLPAHGSSSVRDFPSALVLPELRELIETLLSENRAERYADARAAVVAVDSVLESYARARRVWVSLELGPCPY